MIKKVNIQRLKHENFLIIPIPLEDEILSSWIVRTAYAHKTHPHTFTNQYLNYRHHSFFLTESDITLNAKMIEILEQKSNSKVDINSLMLKTYSGYLQENIIDNPNVFICDLKYCPACLKEDKVPYFRKIWRVIFYNICHKHKCRLYEHCPGCKTKLDISKMYKNELQYTYCHKCGFELKKGRKIPINKKSVSARIYQNKIFEIINNGYTKLGDSVIYSFLFLEIFIKFSKLVLVDNKHKFIDIHPLFALIKNTNKQNLNHPICKRISAKEQSAFFGLTMYIFDNYPHNIRKFILDNGLTYHDLTTKMSNIPFWYETIINEITPRYSPHSMTVTKEEVAHAERYLKSIGKDVNKVNLTKLLGCNFYSNDNDLKKYLKE